MKKQFFLLSFMAISLSISAQRASDASVSINEIKDYNRIGVSYNNSHYGFNKDFDDDLGKGINLNGFGIEYIHGFSLSEQLPMYIETGLNFNMDFGSKIVYEEYEENYWYNEKLTTNNMNLQVPVNYVWKFGIGDDFSISPYFGLNFKVHVLGRVKFKTDSTNHLEGAEETKWLNLFDKKDMDGKDYTWNRFQMGWHIGVGFQYKPLYFGVQYGTDFIPAYSHKEVDGRDSWEPKVSTGSLKVSVAYVF